MTRSTPGGPVRPALLLLVVLVPLAACGGDAEPGPDPQGGPEAAEAPAEAAPMSVAITAPADGARVSGNVVIRLETAGLDIVPAGQAAPHSGHHHLIVNADLPPMDAPIPAVAGSYIHLGAAQTEWDLGALPPGEYTVIALVGDHAHVPLDPPVADTAHFTVRE